MVPEVTILRAAPKGLLTADHGAPALGVLGGLFNPVTGAHLALGQAALEQFSLGEVLYVLPQVPPHKTFFGARPEDRVAMLALAIDPYERFSAGVSSHGLFIDIHRGVQPIYPEGTRVYFITGADAAERILTWPYADRAAALRDMFDRFELIVADRGQAFTPPPDPALWPYAGRTHRLDLPPTFQEHSSSLVRRRLQEGQPIDDLVPGPVGDFIRARGLYRAEAAD